MGTLKKTDLNFRVLRQYFKCSNSFKYSGIKLLGILGNLSKTDDFFQKYFRQLAISTKVFFTDVLQVCDDDYETSHNRTSIFVDILNQGNIIVQQLLA